MSEPLVGRTVVLAITGSIAAYKGAEVARRLMDLGADVHVTLTSAGAEFITPLTLQTLTGNPVVVDMFDEPEEWEVRHVSLAERAAALVVAPATADAIARLALGLADGFAYTVALATRAPLVVAPAMNHRMYSHPSVQEHIARLRERGAHIVEPETGRLASGAVGQGRLAEPEAIAAAVASVLSRGDMKGLRVLVTAGPTREPLDPVRFISNRSSGKMGYALARAAVIRGAAVRLVSGPTCLPEPDGCEVIRVDTAADMLQATLDRFTECDVLIAAAAVADYSPADVSTHKMKKGDAPVTVELRPTTDILGECAARRGPEQFLVGFAAETEDIVEHAREKLVGKGLDLIVANDVSRVDLGFDSDDNAGHFVFSDGRAVEVPQMDKSSFAERVLDAVVAWRRSSTG